MTIRGGGSKCCSERRKSKNYKLVRGEEIMERDGERQNGGGGEGKMKWEEKRRKYKVGMKI